MSQSDLFDSNAEPGAPRSRQPYNWFFALRPSADDAQRIYDCTADLLRLNGFRGMRLAPERLHVSLVGLDPHLLKVQQEAAFLAADSVRFESFELLFDVAMSYTGSNAFVLAGGNHAAQVRSLCAPLEKALRRYGFASLKVSRPHMTLCYDSQTKLMPVGIEPIGFRATGFALAKSQFGKSHHEVVRTWPSSNSAAPE